MDGNDHDVAPLPLCSHSNVKTKQNKKNEKNRKEKHEKRDLIHNTLYYRLKIHRN